MSLLTTLKVSNVIWERCVIRKKVNSFTNFGLSKSEIQTVEVKHIFYVFSLWHRLWHEVRQKVSHHLRSKVSHFLRNYLQEKVRTLLWQRGKIVTNISTKASHSKNGSNIRCGIAARNWIILLFLVNLIHLPKVEDHCFRSAFQYLTNLTPRCAVRLFNCALVLC